MSLVSNFIGGISASQFGGSGKVSPDFDLNDTTFSDLLEKQMNITPEQKPDNMFGTLGVPSGFEIQSLDGTEYSEKVMDQMEAAGEKPEENSSNMPHSNQDNDVTTSEAVTFFTSLLDNSTSGNNARSELFDFARKQAANFYNQYSRSIVTDVQEFVQDIKGMI